MSGLTQEVWEECVAEYNAIWPHAALNPSSAVRWGNHLRNVPGEAVYAAIQQLAMTSEHAPRLAQIGREAMTALGLVAPGFPEAYAEIIRRIQTHGTLPPSWSHPAIEEVVASIGWRQIGLSSTDDRAFYARCRDTYVAIAGRADREAAMALCHLESSDGIDSPAASWVRARLAAAAADRRRLALGAPSEGERRSLAREPVRAVG